MSILRQLNQRPIAYYPIYRQITGSTTAGILLSQLMYWFSKKDRFHKADLEIIEETLLTKKEFETAKKKIKDLDFILVERKGIPARTFYEINWQKYETCLHQSSSTVYPNGGNCTPQKGEAILYRTKTTTKTTTKNKKINKKEIVLPENLNLEAYEMWCNYKGKNYSDQGKKLSINKLAKFTKELQMQMVENSIMNNYAGLFEIKTQVSKSTNQQNQKSIEIILQEYIQDRKSGIDQNIAAMMAKEKINWSFHKQLETAIQDLELKLICQNQAVNAPYRQEKQFMQGLGQDTSEKPL